MTTPAHYPTGPHPPPPGPCTTEQHTTSAQQATCDRNDNVGMGVFAIGAVVLLVLGWAWWTWMKRRVGRRP